MRNSIGRDKSVKCGASPPPQTSYIPFQPNHLYHHNSPQKNTIKESQMAIDRQVTHRAPPGRLNSNCYSSGRITDNTEVIHAACSCISDLVTTRSDYFRIADNSPGTRPTNGVQVSTALPNLWIRGSRAITIDVIEGRCLVILSQRLIASFRVARR